MASDQYRQHQWLDKYGLPFFKASNFVDMEWEE
jgi:hypothetical protein